MKEKKTRDAEATKAVILAAAEQLFAERGFAGTSISMVAKRSNVSSALILFHFKDKQGLYRAVKAFIVKRYTETSSDIIEPTDGLKSLLSRILHAMSSFYRTNPAMIRMANWGRLEGDTDLWPGEEEWHHMYIQQMESAQKRGELRADISPYRALIMITGALHTWWEYRDHYLCDLDQQDCPEKADQMYVDELLMILMRGLSSDRYYFDHLLPGSDTLTHMETY